MAYLQTSQSLIGQDYDAKIYTGYAGNAYSTIIHVIAATYPTDMFINTRAESNVLLKSCPGFIEFPATNSSASFFVDSNQTYSGVIRSVTYTFKRLSDNAQISYTTGESGDNLSNFIDPYL
jgi:hypothetical protein